MVRDWISKPLTLALGLGLTFGLVSNASAQFVRPRASQPYCPCPPGTPGSPGSSSEMAPAPRPFDPNAPATPADPNAPAQPADPNAPNAQQPQAQNQQPNATDFSQAPSAETSGAGGPMSSGASTPFAGRLDSNNRFNIFDNMSAIPANRAWVGYMYTGDTNTNTVLSDQGKYVKQNFPSYYNQYAGPDEGILKKHGQNTMRFGVELVICDGLSIAAQGQYVDPTISGGAEESFSNPQFLLKYVLAETDYCVMSATFGYQPDIVKGKREVTDITERYYPGLINYLQLTDDVFLQSSGQFGLPQSGDLYTADWAVGLGWWMYRHESLDRNYAAWKGSLCNGGGCNGGPMLLGIVPQLEFFGHHVLGDTTYKGPANLSTAPIGSPAIGQFYNQPFFLGEEPRHIFDATAGVQWVLQHGLVLGTGVSVPLSSGNNQVRNIEFLATLNCYF